MNSQQLPLNFISERNGGHQKALLVLEICGRRCGYILSGTWKTIPCPCLPFFHYFCYPFSISTSREIIRENSDWVEATPCKYFLILGTSFPYLTLSDKIRYVFCWYIYALTFEFRSKCPKFQIFIRNFLLTISIFLKWILKLPLKKSPAALLSPFSY